MKKELSFEGIPPRSAGSTAKQANMSGLLRKTMFGYIDTGVWDVQEIEISQIWKFLLADQTVDNDSSSIEDLKSSSTRFASDFPQGNHVDIADQCDAAVARKASGTGSTEAFQQQDANLDRLFHFLYLM